MSYDLLWSVPFSTLRKNGFRPLCDQAWAGVKTREEFERARDKAHRMGLRVMVPITRQEIHGFRNYSCDLSVFDNLEVYFRWSYVPFLQLTEREKRHGRNDRLIEPTRVAGYGFFASESDAVAWKLMVTG